MQTGSQTTAQVRVLHGIFEQQARATPAALALDVPPPRPGLPRQVLTYAALDAAANALAGRLAAHVHGECVVAVLLPRAGPELFTAQLGIMTAGAAWTCIEPSTPLERLRLLIEDSQAVAVVTDEAGAKALECTGFPPFARALQREVEIPIFSWGSLLDYAYATAVHRDYYGHV